MNNKLKNTLLGGLLSASLAAPALAGDFQTPIASAKSSDMFDFSAGYHSSYVFRGFNVGDDLVDYGLKTSTTLGCYDLTVGLWQANVISNNSPADLETDFYVDVAKDLGFAKVNAGYIFYYFDGNTSANTQELYLGLSKNISGIDFSAKYFHDFDQVEEGYFELSAAKSLNLGGHSFDASLVVGFSVDESEVSHIQPTISKSFNLNSAVTLTPYLSYSFAIGDVDYAGNAIDDEFVAGLSIGFSF